jgi:hypothetical protein
VRQRVGDRESVLSPREVAESAIAAVEADRVHVAPGAGVLSRAKARAESLLCDLTAAVE